MEVARTKAGLSARDWKYRARWVDAAEGVRSPADLFTALRRADPLEPRKATDGEAPDCAGVRYDDLCYAYDGVEADLCDAVTERRVMVFSRDYSDPRPPKQGSEPLSCDDRARLICAALQDEVAHSGDKAPAGRVTRAVRNIVHGRSGSGITFYHRSPGPADLFSHLLQSPAWAPGGEARELWSSAGGGGSEILTRSAVYAENLTRDAGRVAPLSLTDEVVHSGWAAKDGTGKRRRRAWFTETNGHMRSSDDFPWSSGGVVYDFSKPFSHKDAEERWQLQKRARHK